MDRDIEIYNANFNESNFLLSNNANVTRNLVQVLKRSAEQILEECNYTIPFIFTVEIGEKTEVKIWKCGDEEEDIEELRAEIENRIGRIGYKTEAHVDLAALILFNAIRQIVEVQIIRPDGFMCFTIFDVILKKGNVSLQGKINSKDNYCVSDWIDIRDPKNSNILIREFWRDYNVGKMIMQIFN